MSDYVTFTLDNGLRCVFRKTDEVGYCGLVVKAGSRDDGKDFGLAHFVEHTIFKGTIKRRSRHIASRMECVGGDLNAFTTKEDTTVYTAFPAGYHGRALELLSDLALNSTFPMEELEKERDVVVDEINLYLDNPAEAIFDEFEDLIFKGSAVGHNILGTIETLKELNHEKCLSFRKKFYNASNVTLYIADNCSQERAMRNVARYFDVMPSGERNLLKEPLAHVPMFDKTVVREGYQSHTILGTRISNKYDADRFALYLLNNYLGGPSMNSLLNRELRDKRGYVYNVDSSINLMEDSGTFQIYFGCERKNLKSCLKIIRRLLESLAETSMKPSVFDRIRRQYMGQLIVGGDNRESQAIGMGKSLLYYGQIHDLEFTRSRIMELSAEDIRKAAQKVIESGLSRLTIEPSK